MKLSEALDDVAGLETMSPTAQFTFRKASDAAHEMEQEIGNLKTANGYLSERLAALEKAKEPERRDYHCADCGKETDAIFESDKRRCQACHFNPKPSGWRAITLEEFRGVMQREDWRKWIQIHPKALRIIDEKGEWLQISGAK